MSKKDIKTAAMMAKMESGYRRSRPTEEDFKIGVHDKLEGTSATVLSADVRKNVSWLDCMSEFNSL